MWTKSYEPTESDWYIVKINGAKMPMMWNIHNKFFSDFAGKTYRFDEIECWLNDSATPNWHKCADGLPSCSESGEWDGLRSGLLIAETDRKEVFIARCYEGTMDGHHFFDWYQFDAVRNVEWLIDNVAKWREI